jgi:hypothetical protein
MSLIEHLSISDTFALCLIGRRFLIRQILPATAWRQIHSQTKGHFSIRVVSQKSADFVWFTDQITEFRAISGVAVSEICP